MWNQIISSTRQKYSIISRSDWRYSQLFFPFYLNHFSIWNQIERKHSTFNDHRNLCKNSSIVHSSTFDLFRCGIGHFFCSFLCFISPSCARLSDRPFCSTSSNVSRSHDPNKEQDPFSSSSSQESHQNTSPSEPDQQESPRSHDINSKIVLLPLNINVTRRLPIDPPFIPPTRSSVTPPLTPDERRKAIDAGERAKAAEELWDTFVPDRKMGLQSPMFWILLALCIVLHQINELRDMRSGINEKDVEEERLRQKAMEKQKERSKQLEQIESSNNESSQLEQ